MNLFGFVRFVRFLGFVGFERFDRLLKINYFIIEGINLLMKISPVILLYLSK